MYREEVYVRILLSSTSLAGLSSPAINHARYTSTTDRLRHRRPASPLRHSYTHAQWPSRNCTICVPLLIFHTPSSFIMRAPFGRTFFLYALLLLLLFFSPTPYVHIHLHTRLSIPVPSPSAARRGAARSVPLYIGCGPLSLSLY